MVRAGSNHSSLSAEENIELSPAGRSLLVPQMLCRARAIVDYAPNIYEKDSLRYKVRYLNNRANLVLYDGKQFSITCYLLTERRHHRSDKHECFRDMAWRLEQQSWKL